MQSFLRKHSWLSLCIFNYLFIKLLSVRHRLPVAIIRAIMIIYIKNDDINMRNEALQLATSIEFMFNKNILGYARRRTLYKV